MSTDGTQAEAGDLCVRGQVMLAAGELAELRAALGEEELSASSTLRRWIAGEDLRPHSVAVAVETQLRMLFGTPPEACALLEEVIDRLAVAFPEEVQPLDTF